jgi:hypothetical protein
VVVYVDLGHCEDRRFDSVGWTLMAP